MSGPQRAQECFKVLQEADYISQNNKTSKSTSTWNSKLPAPYTSPPESQRMDLNTMIFKFKKTYVVLEVR